MSELVVYQIQIKGHVDAAWTNWFFPLIVINEQDGEATLTGAVRDQAELHGLLERVFDLNLTLLSVKRMTNTVDEARPG